MSNMLLIGKSVNIDFDHIGLLSFIHPDFKVLNNIDEYIPYESVGIIYTGHIDNNIKSNLKDLTDNFIIVDHKNYDIDLTTNEGLIKNLLPIHYIRIRNESLKNHTDPVYNTMDYDVLLDEIKNALVCNSEIHEKENYKLSVYNLFTSLLSTPDVFNEQFFCTVNNNNINVVTSSILKFLELVQSNNTSSKNLNYAKLITISHARYGKRIHDGIVKFIKSKSKPEISLYNLLSFLNKAK